MQRLLECPICIHYYDTQARVPKTLMCGHGFCVVCLKDLVIGPGVKCPTCRRECVLPEGKVEKLPTTYASLDLLDTSCEECRDQSWTQRCSHCSRNLCDKCQDSHLTGTPYDLWTELKSLKDAVVSLKKESVDDSIIKQISSQGEITITNINHTYQEWIEEFQRQNKKLILQVKEQMQRDNERVHSWSSDIVKKLPEVNKFIEQTEAEILSPSSSTSSVDQTTAKELCIKKLDSLKSARDAKPVPTTVTFRASQERFDFLLSKCGQIFTSKGGEAFKPGGAKHLQYTLATYKTVWSKQDCGGDDFWWPWGIAVSPITQNIVVIDFISHSIQVHTKSFNLAYKLAHTSTSSSQSIQQPFGLAINKANEILITDQASHCIHVTDEWGNSKATYGNYGKGPGELDKPNGLAIDDDGLIYVCDGGNLRVQVLHSDGSFMSVIDKDTGSGKNFFLFAPFFIAVSSHGILAVTDVDGSLHLMTTKGQWLKTIEARLPPHNMDASGVVFDSRGNLIVADQSGVLVVLQENGQYICTVGTPGRRAGQLMDPRGVVITQDGNIAVCDMSNQRIQLFDVPTT